MNLAAVFSLLILGMLTLTLPACKRNTAKQAPLLSSGSASGGVTEEEINEEIQAGNLEVHQNQDEALQALGAPTWDEDEEEEEEAAPAKPDMDVQAEEQKAQQGKKRQSLLQTMWAPKPKEPKAM